MPWLSLAQYTQLIHENATAQTLINENERLRGELAQTQAKLDAEIARNREREDAEISRNRNREDRLLDRVVTSKGANPVTPVEKKAKPSPSSLPLTALEEANLQMYIEDAAACGYGADVARRKFERDRKLKLEPQADLSMYDDLPVIQPIKEIEEEIKEEIEEEIEKDAKETDTP